MRKVFLVEPNPRFDLLWLYEHYKVGYIFNDRNEIAAYEKNLESLYKKLTKWAKNYFDPDKDALAMTGSLATLCITVLALQNTWPGKKLKLLKYDTSTETYEEAYGFSSSTNTGNLQNR